MEGKCQNPKTIYQISPLSDMELHITRFSEGLLDVPVQKRKAYVNFREGTVIKPPVQWLQPASGYHTTPAKPQRNTNTHRTRAIQPMK